MLTSILLPEARERLGRVAVVKPDIARAVEDHLLGLFRSGKLREQVTEGLLIKLLEQVGSAGGGGAGGGSGGSGPKVVVQRKKRVDDDSDNDDDL